MFALKRKYVPYLFLLVPLLGLMLFRIYPLFSGLYDSLFKYSFLNKTSRFIGLDHYIKLFTDPVFLNSLWVTVLFNLITNPLQIAIALGLACLLTLKLKGNHFFRTLHLVPITVSFTIACTLWGVLLNPDQGLLNSILNVFGIPNQPFLTSAGQSLGCVIAIASWKGIGYWAVFLIAGIENIPRDLYEAANIDGAGYGVTFRKITLPMLKNTLLFVIVSDTISNFLLFVPAYMLTGGGPQGSTDFLMYEIYQNAYAYSNMNVASAMVMILLLILLAVIGAESLLVRGKEH